MHASLRCLQRQVPLRALTCSFLLLVGGLPSVTVAAKPGEWQVLFDGSDLSAWKPYGKPDDAPIAWVIESGALAWRKDCGNLATKELFGDFELELEWKISPAGNSGVMFGVDDSGEKPWHTGPEVQLLDDMKARDGKNPLTRAGALYSLYPPTKSAAKPIGEWNKLRLRVQSGRVEGWLNGEAIFDVRMTSADWHERVAKSKFGPFPRFGKVTPGRIVLQDHLRPVWFRAIRIRRS